MSSMNMSIKNNKNPIIASGLVVVEKIGVNNLDLYIPRINESYSEDEIKYVFQSMGIGMVDYVDFVATKDPETKQIKYYSAFLRLIEWNPNGSSYNKIIVEKQNKIQVSRTEYWVLLPAKTPLSRSKVNTHQLAAYTDELYVRIEAIEKSATENITVSSTHFQNLLAKSEAQTAQIEQLMKIIELQSKKIQHIEKYLMNEEEPELRKPRALTIEDLNSEDLIPDQCEVYKKKEETTVEQLRAEQKTPVVFCDDECFFFKPLVTETTGKLIPIKTKSDVMSGSFSYDLEELLGPVSKSMGLTIEEVRKGIQEEWANSQRVKGSINYCGNE